jgi:hypothetical protein
MARKEKAWMIWDCTTGSVDGYYFDKKLAEDVFNGLQKEGCVSIILCGIENKKSNQGIPDHLWHASNGVGFFGRGVIAREPVLSEDEVAAVLHEMLGLAQDKVIEVQG